MEVAVNARGVHLREVAVGGGTPVVNTIAAGEVEKFEEMTERMVVGLMGGQTECCAQRTIA